MSAVPETSAPAVPHAAGPGPGRRRAWSPARLPRWLWHSPTFTTWASIGGRSLGFLLVLPLVLQRFPPAESALFLLVATLVSFQTLFFISVSTTLVRAISLALGGAVSLESAGFARGGDSSAPGRPNWPLVARAHGVSRRLANWTVPVNALAGIALFAAVAPPGAAASPAAWLAWLPVLVGTGFACWGNAYAVFLQGTNHVALLRRWEAVFSLAAVLAPVAVILAGGGLALVVAAWQVWLVVGAVRNRLLARRVLAGWLAEHDRPRHDRVLLAQLRPAIWRSVAGVLANRGVVLLSAAATNRWLPPADAAQTMLAVQLLTGVASFAQAPFYSKLPLLTRLLAQGERARFRQVAARGQRLGYVVFVAGWLGLALAGGALLRTTGLAESFPGARLWFLFGLAFLCERFGAAHLQIYSCTNHILWHKVNGLSGAVMLAGFAALLPGLGLYALPAAQLAANALVFSVWSARLSYGLLETNFLAWERKSFLPSVGIMALLGMCVMWLAER